MNSFGEAIILAVTQGLTEFLPISSSAHLILVPLLLGWPDQGIVFDIAVHIGTLFAVCLYFHTELRRLWQGWLRSLKGRPSRFYSHLAWQLMVATLPIALIGWLAHDIVATKLRSPLVIAGATIFFGLILLLADHLSNQRKGLRALNWRNTFFIGIAQTLALIPGASRSGITLTAGLALGYNRKSSAKFSFLLSIPAISLAGGYEGLKMLKSSNPINWPILSVGIIFATLSAYFCIHGFLLLIRKIGMLPFVIYRLLLGGFLLFLFF